MKTYEEAISGLRKYMPEHAAVIDRENARLRAAIEAMPTCRCGMSTDEQSELASENAKLREAGSLALNALVMHSTDEDTGPGGDAVRALAPRFHRWRVRKKLPDGFYTARTYKAPVPVTADDVLTSPAVLEWLGKDKVAEVYHPGD